MFGRWRSVLLFCKIFKYIMKGEKLSFASGKAPRRPLMSGRKYASGRYVIQMMKSLDSSFNAGWRHNLSTIC
jgi:hypothetical protein